jgi:autotransporter strand-loop-strand O-heptosyltransferase
MKTIYLMPHTSTGGMPAFALKRIQAILKYTEGFNLYAIEHNFHGDAYVVQRNQIKDLLGDKFYSMFENKMQIMDIINEIQPDIVHIDDVAERLDRGLATALYNNNRTYRIIETPHDVIFNPDYEKIFHPDLYLFCSFYHENSFANMDSQFYTIQYPIENKMAPEKKHNAKLDLGFNLFKTNVINVGLFTPGKNQGEGFDIARKNPDIDFHFIGNTAENFKFFWEPLLKDVPPNVKIWGERDDVEKFMIAADVFMFNSINECAPIVLKQAASFGLPIIARKLPTYAGMYDRYIQPLDTDLKNIQRNYKIPNNINTRNFALEHEKAYYAILKFSIRKQAVIFHVNFIGAPFLEIKGISDSDFLVKFYDEKNECHYTNTIKSNHWVKLNRQWFTNWTVRVWENGQDLVYKYTLNLEGKEVLITIDSKALGDTMAFIPYCEAFQEKHKCKVTVSTFWNKILDYPNLKLIEPGQSIGCYAMYHLGYFHDSDKEPVPANKVPLQQSACNILGLDYVELVPKVKVNRERLDLGRYVAIATNSTAQCKFWTREGWQILINHLHSKGYRVINVSRETNPFDNCEPISNTSIEYTMQVIAGAEFMVGLSSGLSWLSFAIGTHVVLIANFTAVDYEFSINCTRIVNPKVCHDCWSDHKLDPANWNWCPRNQNFICHTSITAQMVIDKLPIL